MSEFKEIEYKYSANGISKDVFKKVCDKIHSKETKQPISFWDTLTGQTPHITNAISSDAFYVNLAPFTYSPDIVRYRYNHDRKELTLKKNTNKENCINRQEINLSLVNTSDFNTVDSFLNMLGYTFDYEIEKDFTIYHFDDCEIVYYTVYDQGKKLESFIEIEATKYSNEAEAVSIIDKYEDLLIENLLEFDVKLDIRVNESLYTLIKKYIK
jgi:adenylate cyclase class IV